MSLFQKRQDYIPPKVFVAGTTDRIELTREFAIESIFLRVRFTTGVASSDFGTTGDGILAAVKKITLTVSDGSRTRNVIDASGAALVEYARQINGTLDRLTQASMSGSSGTTPLVIPAGSYCIVIPIYFAHPGMDDPVGSVCLLPAPRFSANPVLQIQWGTAAEMGASLTLTPNWFDLVVNRRQVNMPNWTYYDTELVENQITFAAAGSNQIYELPTPGSFTGVLLRGYLTSSTKGDITTGVNATTPLNFIPSSTISTPEVKLQLLGTVLRRFKTQHCELENDLSCALSGNQISNPNATGNNFPVSPGYSLGNFYMDFLNDKTGTTTADFGSLLDANVLLATGNRIQLFTDVNASGNIWKILSHRIYGDLSPFKLGARPVSKK